MVDTLERPDLVTQIAEHLSRVVLSGAIATGERLNEVTLARDLGVSRGPLREAARLLESRGLLVAYPRRGFFVRSFDAATLDDIYDLRTCIEAHGARLAASRMKAADHRRLADLVARIVATADDTSAQVEADFAFHHELARLSGNARLLRVFEDLALEIRLVLTLLGQMHDDPHVIAASHIPVLEALTDGDPVGITAAIEEHIGVARERVVARMTERHLANA